MPENQASTLELLVGVARGSGPLQRQVEDQLRAAIRVGSPRRRRAPARVARARRRPRRLARRGERRLHAARRGGLAGRGAPLAAAGRCRGRGGRAAGGSAPTSHRPTSHGPRRAGPRRAGPRRAGARRAAHVAPAHVAPAHAAPPHAAPAHVAPPHVAPPHAAPGYPAGPDARIAPGSIPRPARIRYDLRPGRPDLARFPRADWVRSLSAAVRGAGVAELDYPPIAGAIPLREVVAAYRGRVRGTVARGEDVILCAGAGQAFVTIAEALGPVKLAVEDPGHEGIRGLFAKRGLRPVPTRVDDHGVVVDELPDDAGAVLLTPAHQFPTGAVLSAERRAALLAWAAERGALIIEDDYDAEYRYDRAPIGALQGLRPDLVAHVGSVSKTLAPALRLGWLIAPRAWRDRLLEARASLDHGLPALEQLALADFITRGAYDRHLRRSGRAYRRRRDALIEALTRALPGATVLRRRRRPAHRRPHPGRGRARARPRVRRRGRDPRRHHAASRRPRPVGPADQLRRGPRRGRRPRRRADRLSALRRRRRTACGWRARSTRPACGAPGRVAWPGSRRRGSSRPARPRRCRPRRRRPRASETPFGQEPMPSLWAASSMFWAARPASRASGPLPETTIATTSAAPRMFSGFQTAARDAPRGRAGRRSGAAAGSSSFPPGGPPRGCGGRRRPAAAGRRTCAPRAAR